MDPRADERNRYDARGAGPGEFRVSFTEQLGCLGLMCAALTACDTKALNAAISLQRRVSEIAGQANGAAPAAIDPDTRLDGAKAGPGLRLAVMYTLVNAEANGVDGTTFGAKLTPNIVNASCTNPDLRPVIDQGVVVVLEYRGRQGNLIGTVNIDRARCAALK